MGNSACFQGLAPRSPLKDGATPSAQQPARTQELASTVKEMDLPAEYVGMEDAAPGKEEVEPEARVSKDESNLEEAEQKEENMMAEGELKFQPNLEQKSETKPTAEEEQEVEADQADKMRTDEAKPADDTSKSVSSYMWMWGDCNPVATFNPARWSEWQSAEGMIHDLRWQQSKHLLRPVKIKDQGSGSWYFNTVEQAASALTHAMATGGKLQSFGQATEDVDKPVTNEENEKGEPGELEESMEISSKLKEETETAEQVPTDEGTVAEETPKRAPSYMWMWGDCNPVATFNPVRWSDYQNAESMINSLHSQKSPDLSHLSRPIKIKDRTFGNWRFSSVDEAILALTQAVEDGGQLCSQ